LETIKFHYNHVSYSNVLNLICSTAKCISASVILKLDLDFYSCQLKKCSNKMRIKNLQLEHLAALSSHFTHKSLTLYIYTYIFLSPFSYSLSFLRTLFRFLCIAWSQSVDFTFNLLVGLIWRRCLESMRVQI